MPKFSTTLHEPGDHVVVTLDGGRKAAGVVREWRHLGSREPDTMHVVVFDDPVETKDPTGAVVHTLLEDAFPSSKITIK